MNGTLLREDDGGRSDVYRYCPTCNDSVVPSIGDETDENYHSDDVSPVKCPECGNGLGHLVWWPYE